MADVAGGLTPGGSGQVVPGAGQVFDQRGATAVALNIPPPAVFYFKMRALANPGPGYETWIVSGDPDFAGTNAPGPIQAGTVVLAATWQV